MGSDGATHEVVNTGVEISIHAPRMGSDTLTMLTNRGEYTFQSTLPGWGATLVTIVEEAGGEISIHAPRMGSDRPQPAVRDRAGHISIHAPRMGSDSRPSTRSVETSKFQSTLPGWGATMQQLVSEGIVQFQSTLPGWGATAMRLITFLPASNFNPRSPDGERQHHQHRA